jgi:DNA-3-methyladenine glycosylase II
MILDSQVVVVSLEQIGAAEQPELEVNIACENPSPRIKQAAESALIRLLGLNVDMSGFYAAATVDVQLASLVEKFRGVKPPLYPTLFESIANAIVFQQISLDAGISILNRFAESYGVPCDCAGGKCYLFPEAQRLAGVGADEIRRVGLTANKARALSECAGRIIEQNLSIDDFVKMDNEMAFGELVKLRGIGGWSADYILLRGLGRYDVFPRGDIGARTRLDRWLNFEGRLSNLELENIISRWRGYGGFVYFHLLLHGLAERGLIA